MTMALSWERSRPPSSSSSLAPASAEKSSSSAHKPLSIYVTFKIIRLVNKFRKRVGALPTPRPEAFRPNQELCEEFERQAFDEIDNYLGRKRVYPGKRSAGRKASVQHAAPETGPSPASPTISREDEVLPRRIKGHVNRLLEAVDRTGKSEKQKLITIAANNDRFLRRGAGPHLSSRSIKDALHVLVNVLDLLDTLRRAQLLGPGLLRLCRGDNVLDPALDETCIANLQHLLLCLQTQLIRLLVALSVELVLQHVKEWQKIEGAHCHEHTFEFPNAKHPLSTTWPWSIRPSLAVIWGVCWMFFDYIHADDPVQFDAQGNMVDVQGNIIVPSHAVNQYVGAMHRQRHQQQQQQQQQHYHPQQQQQRQGQGPFRPNEMQLVARFGAADGHVMESSGLGPRHFHSPTSGPQLSLSEERMAGNMPPQPQLAAHQQNSSSPQAPSPASASVSASAGDRTTRATRATTATSAGLSLAIPIAGTNARVNHTHQAYNNSTSAAAPSSPYADSATAASAGWLPQDTPAAALGVDGHFDTDNSAWLPSRNSAAGQQPGLVYESSPQQQQPTLPPHSRNPLTPTIRVTAEWPGAIPDVSQPQDASFSASAGSPLPQTHYTYNPFYSRHLAADPLYQMTGESDTTMQTPVSPVSADNPPHDHTMGNEQQQPPSRKRSHSVMSHPENQILQTIGHSRSESIASPPGASPHDLPDVYSPRGSRAFKRSDPPTNMEGKYICNFAEECAGQIFDRKCEWSKHMDKHDRPYRCPQPQCAKLQGFTYSGGLLRHEREVHGKHGGPKAQLMCPYPDCKRHAGKGFTRKENLNEHLRRVHPKDQESQLSALSRRDAAEMVLAVEEGETPASAMSEQVAHDDFTPSSPIKRKRSSMPAGLHEVDLAEEADREIKRLKASLQQKDDIIRQYEMEILQHEDTKRQLAQLQQLLQQPQPQQEQQASLPPPPPTGPE